MLLTKFKIILGDDVIYDKEIDIHSDQSNPFNEPVEFIENLQHFMELSMSVDANPEAIIAGAIVYYNESTEDGGSLYAREIKD